MCEIYITDAFHNSTGELKKRWQNICKKLYTDSMSSIKVFRDAFSSESNFLDSLDIDLAAPTDTWLTATWEGDASYLDTHHVNADRTTSPTLPRPSLPLPDQPDPSWPTLTYPSPVLSASPLNMYRQHLVQPHADFSQLYSVTHPLLPPSPRAVKVTHFLLYIFNARFHHRTTFPL